jgi:hypothetical protein
MSALPLWIQYGQALAVPVIALAGVAIAAGQLRLAIARLRHDLYERRFKILATVKRLFAVIFADGRVPPEEFYKYVEGTSEAAFLFDSSTVEYLEEIRRRAAKMMFLENRLRDKNLEDAARGKLADKEANLLTWFTSQQELIVPKFRPFMQLARPWTFSSKFPFVAFRP